MADDAATNDDQNTEDTQSELDILRASVDKLEKNNAKLLSEVKSERNKSAELEKAKQETDQAKEKAAEDALKKQGKLDELQKFWESKKNEIEAVKNKEIDYYKEQLVDMTTNAAARKMASNIAIEGKAEVLLPHILQRLNTDWQDGKPTTEVVSTDGTATAMSLDELEAEFVKNPMFDTLIKGNQSSGTGVSKMQRTTPAGKTNNAKEMTRAEYDAMVSEPGGHEKAAKFFEDGGLING